MGLQFVSITHYVQNSFEGRPSFVIEMSDGKDYISNGCVFVENTEENRDKLIKGFDCGAELIALFNADGIAIEELEDGRYMFSGCENLAEFKADMPILEDGLGMFNGCEKLTKAAA